LNEFCLLKYKICDVRMNWAEYRAIWVRDKLVKVLLGRPYVF